MSPTSVTVIDGEKALRNVISSQKPLTVISEQRTTIGPNGVRLRMDSRNFGLLSSRKQTLLLTFFGDPKDFNDRIRFRLMRQDMCIGVEHKCIA